MSVAAKFSLASVTAKRKYSKDSLKAKARADLDESEISILSPIPTSTEDGFPFPPSPIPIFSPIITVDDYDEEDHGEARQMRSYPDPRHDRHTDLMSPLVPLPTPSEVLQRFLEEEKKKKTFVRHYWEKNADSPQSTAELEEEAKLVSGSKGVEENSFFNWPLNVRQNVYKYLLPDEARKITLSEKLSTREVFDDDYFANLTAVYSPIEGAMKTCKAMHMDLKILFWAKYKFHITLDPFTYEDRKGLKFLLCNIKHVQHLTIELDYTRYAFSKAPGCGVLKHDVSRYSSCMRSLVNGFLRRKSPIPLLHLAIRRWGGYREIEDSGGELVPFCPDETLRSIQAVAALGNGKISTLRMSGFSKQYTVNMMKVVFGRKQTLTTPEDPPWPPVPLPAPLRNKIFSTPSPGKSPNPDPVPSVSLDPDLFSWKYLTDDWRECKDIKIEDDSGNMQDSIGNEQFLQVPRERTEHSPQRIPIEDLIAASRGTSPYGTSPCSPSPSRSQPSLASPLIDSQNSVGLIPSAYLPARRRLSEPGVFYGTFETPSRQRLQQSREALSPVEPNSSSNKVETHATNRYRSFPVNSKIRAFLGFDGACDTDEACESNTGSRHDENKKGSGAHQVNEDNEVGGDTVGNGGEDSENFDDGDNPLLVCPNSRAQRYKFPFLATALFDFSGQDQTELDFVAGEMIIVTCFLPAETEWEYGVIGNTRRRGFIPKEFVRVEKVLFYAVAIFDYTYDYAGPGCNFNAGDRIAVMDVCKDPAYLVGFNTKTGQYGLLQRNYVHEGNSDINLTAQKDGTMYRALVIDAGVGTSAIFPNKFRTGDHIDVLQCVDDSKGVFFGQNCRTKTYGRFSKEAVHILPDTPSVLCKVIAIADFRGNPFAEIHFDKGDEMEIVDYVSPEMWYGKSLKTGQLGLVSVEYIQVQKNMEDNLSIKSGPSDPATPKNSPKPSVIDVFTSLESTPRPSSDVSSGSTDHDNERAEADTTSNLDTSMNSAQGLGTISEEDIDIIHNPDDQGPGDYIVHESFSAPANDSEVLSGDNQNTQSPGTGSNSDASPVEDDQDSSQKDRPFSVEIPSGDSPNAKSHEISNNEVIQAENAEDDGPKVRPFSIETPGGDNPHTESLEMKNDGVSQVENDKDGSPEEWPFSVAASDLEIPSGDSPNAELPEISNDGISPVEDDKDDSPNAESLRISNGEVSPVEDDKDDSPNDRQLNSAAEIISPGLNLRPAPSAVADSHLISQENTTAAPDSPADQPEISDIIDPSKAITQTCTVFSDHPVIVGGIQNPDFYSSPTRSDNLLMPTDSRTPSSSVSPGKSSAVPGKSSWRSRSLRQPQVNLDTLDFADLEDSPIAGRSTVLTKPMPCQTSLPPPKTPEKALKSRVSIPGSYGESHSSAGHHKLSMRNLKSMFSTKKETLQPIIPTDKEETKASTQDILKERSTHTYHSKLPVFSKDRIASSPRTGIPSAKYDGSASEAIHGTQSSRFSARIQSSGSPPLSQSSKGSGPPSGTYLSPGYQHGRLVSSEYPNMYGGSSPSDGTVSPDQFDVQSPSDFSKKLRPAQSLGSLKKSGRASTPGAEQKTGARFARFSTPPPMTSPAEKPEVPSARSVSDGESLVAFLENPKIASSSMNMRRKSEDFRRSAERGLMREGKETETSRGNVKGRNLGGEIPPSRLPTPTKLSHGRDITSEPTPPIPAIPTHRLSKINEKRPLPAPPIPNSYKNSASFDYKSKSNEKRPLPAPPTPNSYKNPASFNRQSGSIEKRPLPIPPKEKRPLPMPPKEKRPLPMPPKETRSLPMPPTARSSASFTPQSKGNEKRALPMPSNPTPYNSVESLNRQSTSIERKEGQNE